jgi:hypothetical protein
MSCYACRSCLEPWPTSMKLKKCPDCDGQLFYDSTRNPIDQEEAERRLRFANFRHYYDRREAEREKRGEPTPEEQERAERQAMEDNLAA